MTTSSLSVISRELLQKIFKDNKILDVVIHSSIKPCDEITLDSYNNLIHKMFIYKKSILSKLST